MIIWASVLLPLLCPAASWWERERSDSDDSCADSCEPPCRCPSEDEAPKECQCLCSTCSGPRDCCAALCPGCGRPDASPQTIVLIPYPYPLPMMATPGPNLSTEGAATPTIGTIRERTTTEPTTTTELISIPTDATTRPRKRCIPKCTPSATPRKRCYRRVRKPNCSASNAVCVVNMAVPCAPRACDEPEDPESDDRDASTGRNAGGHFGARRLPMRLRDTIPIW